MKYYVTTSIPYVNGDPHLGHALEFIMADVLARAARQAGKQTMFLTGTDEHGGKVAQKAAELSMTPQDFTDQMSQGFRDLAQQLNISNDRFIRTTDDQHEQRAQIIWQALEDDIYKSSYTGLYCTGCESFVTEAVAKENNYICPNHNQPYEKIQEENYFFKLSKYSKKIQAAIESDQFRVIPTTKKHEILNVIKDGLDDISVSRPKDKITWGIPVPGDETQGMYVWFEALMNYITALGYPDEADFAKFWPADVQVIGKDILRFHAAIWPGILLALGLPLPKVLYVHGFINIEGQKMSKSLGNFVAPAEIIDQYSSDVLRYYLLRHIPSYEDGDFSQAKLLEVYNNELGNELGNAVQRTSAMIERYLAGSIGQVEPTKSDTTAYSQALDQCRFDRALESVWTRVRGLNQYIEEAKPWQIAKSEDTERLQEVLSRQVADLLEISQLLQPFMPETAAKINSVFASGQIQPLASTLFPRKDTPKTETLKSEEQNKKPD